MLGFQWNALRTGDHVMVHDDLDPGLELHQAVVKLVQTRPRGANDVTIWIDGHSPSMLRPRRHACHLLPLDKRSCWRCDTAAQHAEIHRVAA